MFDQIFTNNGWAWDFRKQLLMHDYKRQKTQECIDRRAESDDFPLVDNNLFYMILVEDGRSPKKHFLTEYADSEEFKDLAKSTILSGAGNRLDFLRGITTNNRIQVIKWLFKQKDYDEKIRTYMTHVILRYACYQVNSKIIYFILYESKPGKKLKNIIDQPIPEDKENCDDEYRILFSPLGQICGYHVKQNSTKIKMKALDILKDLMHFMEEEPSKHEKQILADKARSKDHLIIAKYLEPDKLPFRLNDLYTAHAHKKTYVSAQDLHSLATAKKESINTQDRHSATFLHYFLMIFSENMANRASNKGGGGGEHETDEKEKVQKQYNISNSVIAVAFVTMVLKIFIRCSGAKLFIKTNDTYPTYSIFKKDKTQYDLANDLVSFFRTQAKKYREETLSQLENTCNLRKKERYVKKFEKKIDELERFLAEEEEKHDKNLELSDEKRMDQITQLLRGLSYW